MKSKLKKLFNPLSHRKYKGVSGEYTRSFRIALYLWWSWEVLPWFFKMDYIQSKDGSRVYKYRWEK